MQSAATPTFTQAQTELATGFSREVLRKWELRFGFPLPVRDVRGRRLYSMGDMQQLLLIKQLLLAGHRPRHVLGLTMQALSELPLSRLPPDTPEPGPVAQGLLAALASNKGPLAVDAYLRGRLKKKGLESFVTHELQVLNEAVGNAWANGSLGVHGEHVYTATVSRLVQEKLGELRPPKHAARVLLTTPWGEQHGLGLLALQAALALLGAQCIELGVQTPEKDVVDAVMKWDVSLVCISLSIQFSKTSARAYVSTLRALLPANRHLWIGGQGALALVAEVPAGVLVFESIQAAAQAWRAL